MVIMVQTTKTLHVCPYYPEHKIMARKLYGIDRVNEQIKKHIVYCNECTMFPDLLIYLDIDKDEVKNNISNHGLILDYQIKDIKSQYRRNKYDTLTLGRKEFIYREESFTPDEFFEEGGSP